jgi:hypothetical protein
MGRKGKKKGKLAKERGKKSIGKKPRSALKRERENWGRKG